MGKLPAIFLAALMLWVAWNLYENGSDGAFGGLFDLMEQPQYGEADRPTHSGDLANRLLEDSER